MNINNVVEVTINSLNHNQVIKLLKFKNINIYKITYQKQKIILKIKYEDIEKVNKLYKIEKVKYWGVKAIVNNFNIFLNNLLSIAFLIILISFYTNIIVNLNVTTENTELRQYILNELDKNKLSKYSFAKDDETLLQIKNNILASSKDKIEWLNIERIGMKYIIKVEAKKAKNPTTDLTYCNIIATKDGTISKIISEQGSEVVEINDSVKKGDILISGDIKFNEETKKQVCAKGNVYAKTWYTIDIKTTKTYEEKVKKDNYRYNLLLKYDNKSQKVFKSRIKDNIAENKKAINLFGIELYIQKEYEYELKIIEYSEKVLEEKVNKLIKEELSSTIKEDGRIIEQKVLKKVENDSTIDMIMFIVAEEQIGTMEEIHQEVIVE